MIKFAKIMDGRSALLDLRRFAALGAVTVLALSQPLFTLILENRDEFPVGGLFHVWVLAWAFALPLLALAAVDTLLERRGRRGWTAWRAILCALAALSLLRQACVYYPGEPGGWRPVDAYPYAGTGLALLALAAALKFPAETSRFLSVLGLLAAFFVARYAAATGVWGPAWRPAAPAAAAEEPAETPVFLVVFDELSIDVLLKDGAFDAANYPRFAAFAAENAWFSNATSNFMYTKDALPCMLTGRLKPGASARTLFHFLQRKYEPTLVGSWPFLAHWLRRGARQSVAFELRGAAEESARNPWEAAKVLAEAVWNILVRMRFQRSTHGDSNLMGATSAEFSLKQPELIGEVLARRAGPGLFLFWHSPFPHTPFDFDAEGRRHGRPHRVFVGKQADPQAVYQNYLEQVRLADRLFGRFLDLLRAAKLYDRAIIVVTSDHGLRTFDNLQAPEYPAVLSGLAPRIPLLVRAPGIRPGRHDVDYQHIDLAPTLLDLAGVPVPAGEFEGVSLLSPERPARPKRFCKIDARYEFDASTGLWRRIGD